MPVFLDVPLRTSGGGLRCISAHALAARPPPTLQVEQLPLLACLQLLAILETGTSEDDKLQRQADRLLACTTERLCRLVKLSKEAQAIAADGELQAALTSFFGRWHSMLNCQLRRQVWLALPHKLLLVRRGPG